MPEADNRQPIADGRSNSWLDWTDPQRLLAFLLSGRMRWVLCWLIALGMGWFFADQSWNSFNDSDRVDGNSGHTTIDFGGQWLMGRMIVEGHGRQLYNRNYLRTLACQNYPIADAEPKADSSDAEKLVGWLGGSDRAEGRTVVGSFLAPLAAGNALDESVLLASGESTWTPEQLAAVTDPNVGGALYPPVHALMYAPLALLPPHLAYRVLQMILLGLAFFAGWVIHRMTQGRIWWPIAATILMMFPGFKGCLDLGQNGMITLAIVLFGWHQVTRGREVLAGLCWGLLAFKPVWAAAFFLVPLLTTRWRMAASMALAGLLQIAVTLPVVGWENWRNWLQIGQTAAEEYKRQENWIFLSRDLISVPRRWLLVFDEGLASRLVWESESADGHPEAHPLPAVLGWSLYGLVVGLTLFVLWRRWEMRKAVTGPPAAFILTGALYSCYHFLYYDFVVAALPLALLFTEPRRFFQVVFWRPPSWLRRWMRTEKTEPEPLSEEAHRYYQPSLDLPPPMPLLPGGRRPRWVQAALPPLFLLMVLTLPGACIYFDHSYHFIPFDMVVSLFVWAWCGYRMMRRLD